MPRKQVERDNPNRTLIHNLNQAISVEYATCKFYECDGNVLIQYINMIVNVHTYNQYDTHIYALALHALKCYVYAEFKYYGLKNPPHTLQTISKYINNRNAYITGKSSKPNQLKKLEVKRQALVDDLKHILNRKIVKGSNSNKKMKRLTSESEKIIDQITTITGWITTMRDKHQISYFRMVKHIDDFNETRDSLITHYTYPTSQHIILLYECIKEFKLVNEAEKHSILELNNYRLSTATKEERIDDIESSISTVIYLRRRSLCNHDNYATLQNIWPQYKNHIYRDIIDEMDSHSNSSIRYYDMVDVDTDGLYQMLCELLNNYLVRIIDMYERFKRTYYTNTARQNRELLEKIGATFEYIKRRDRSFTELSKLYTKYSGEKAYFLSEWINHKSQVFTADNRCIHYTINLMRMYDNVVCISYDLYNNFVLKDFNELESKIVEILECHADHVESGCLSCKSENNVIKDRVMGMTAPFKKILAYNKIKADLSSEFKLIDKTFLELLEKDNFIKDDIRLAKHIENNIDFYTRDVTLQNILNYVLIIYNKLKVLILELKLNPKLENCGTSNSNKIKNELNDKYNTALMLYTELTEQIQLKLDCDNDNCAICMQDIFSTKEIAIVKPCRHKFHTSCLDESYKNGHGKCPLCRAPIAGRELPLDTAQFYYQDPDEQKEDSTPHNNYIHSEWGHPPSGGYSSDDLSDNESDEYFNSH